MQEEESALGEKLFEASCKVAISDGQPVAALATIWSHGLSVNPDQSNAFFVPFIDAKKVESVNLRVTVTTPTETIVLFQLGQKSEEFSRRLQNAWGDALAVALLMPDPTVVYEVPAVYSSSPRGSEQTGNCRARIYQTSLVVLPSSGYPQKLPLSSIQSVKLENFRVRLTTASGALEFSKIGNATQMFSDKLIAAQRELETASIDTIKTMLPGLSYEELKKVSSLLHEGRAAGRGDIEGFSENAWKLLEKAVATSAFAETYSYLGEIGEKTLIAVGLRKAMNNVYVWFLVPIRGTPKAGGNALAMEVTSETGHATYLFRVMSRQMFPKASAEQFSNESRSVISEINEAMISTGFRREPIYLTEDQLNTPTYSKYLFASKNLEPLKVLRERYLGRAIHTTFEEWQVDLRSALLFNTTVKDETSKWKPSESSVVEEIAVAEPAAIPAQSVSVTPSPQIPVPRPQPQTSKELGDKTSVMTERILTLTQIEAQDAGKVKIWLKDNELEHDSAIMLTGEDMAKLGAYPGAKVKVTLEKV